MSNYILKLSGSNEIVNIIQWSGSGNLTAPIGYVFEPFVTESVDYINHIDFTDNINTNPTQSVGNSLPINFLGKFSETSKHENLTSAKSLESTYGKLAIQSVYEDGYNVLPGRFGFENDNTLVMSAENLDWDKQESYFNTLASMIRMYYPNNLIKFTNTSKPGSELHFLITGSMNASSSLFVNPDYTSSAQYEYANFFKFHGNLVKDSTIFSVPSGTSFTTHLSSSSDYFETNLSEWYVDLDTWYDTKVGTFYGDFTGTIDGKSIDTIIQEKTSNISLNQYGRLKFEAEQNFNSTSLIIPNYIDVSEAPKSTYFRFNKNKAGNLWNNPDPSVSVITLSLLNLGEGYEGFWRELVDDIFKTNTSGYELTLSSVEYPNTYKTFRIITGTVYQKIFRGSNASPLYSKWKMGEVGTILSDTVIAELRFENEHQYSLAEGYIEYVEFEVTEVESSVDQNRDPIHDDEFTIGFTKNPVKRKQVFEFTSTTTPWKVPAWADELTIYSIGAGGGGGGGASGHGLHLIRDFHEKSSVYVKSYNGVDFSNHKILLKNNLQLLSETDLEMIEFMDKSGHMYVTGGGGGAGGNVAISKIKISDGLIDSNDIGKNIIPRQSKLNIYVGSGGFGGEGSSYKDDLDIELFGGLMRNGIHNEFVFIQDVNGNPIPDAYRMRLSNWYLSRLGMKFKLTNYGQLANIGESHLIIPSWNKDQYHPDSTQMSFYPEYYPSMVTPSGKLHHKKMTSDNVKHFGKRGGFSSVELTEESNTVTNTSIEMIRATGGYGGLAGWGLTAHSSDIHRLCSSFGHQFQHFFIPGGGSSIDSSFGNIEVRPGGHGGYGISLPSIEKVPDSKIFNVKRNYRFGDYPMNRIAEDEAKFRGYEYENSRDYTRSTKMKIHIAPSIPWNSNANNRFQTNEFGDKTLGYTLPWGSTVDVDYYNWENDGHRIYDTTSQLTPNLPAPLGGNGGIGVTWFGLDNSYPYDVHSVDESLNYFNYVGPDEPNGATVDFGNIPSYIERVLFSKINGVVITSNDVEDYFPPRDVFEVQQSRIANNIIFDSDTVAIIEGSSTLVSTVTRTTSNANGYYSFDIGDQGANGGFGVYQTTGGSEVSFDNDGIEVPAEDGRWIGYGGGGGAAAYVTDWNEKDTANIKGQDGGDGYGGIVIIVAEEL